MKTLKDVRGFVSNRKNVSGMALFLEDSVVVRWMKRGRLITAEFGSTSEALRYCKKMGIDVVPVQG